MTFDEMRSLIKYGLHLYPNTIWRQTSEEIDTMTSAWMNWLGDFEKKDVVEAFKSACAESITRFPTAPLVFSYLKAAKRDSFVKYFFDNTKENQINEKHEKDVHYWIISDDGRETVKSMKEAISALF